MPESPRIVELQQKFEDNPRRYFASLANEYRKAGDAQRAISICGIYLEKQPGHIAGQVVLGQALHAAGRIDEAGEVFRTVLTLDPENLIALKCLADIAEAKGDLQQAHENFRKVLTADPRDHDTNRKLKNVEKELKLAAAGTVDDWIPPRSDEFSVVTEDSVSVPEEIGSSVPPAEYSAQESHGVGDLPPAAPDDSPHQSMEVEDLPALEAPAVHEDLPEDDSVDTLLPSTEAEHHPTIAEPVALESAEETLAVPDLLKEAGEVSIPAFVQEDDEFQYRTAEFSLPKLGAKEVEAVATSTEMESEAEALLDEGEIPPPPPPEEGVSFQFDHAMRTGEYSLSRDTDEWNRESAEPASFAAEDVQDAGSEVEPAGPFITETVAELYLQQGFTGEALLVYRQLARSKPNDQRISDRIAELEGRLADEHAARQAAFETTPPLEASTEPAREITWEPAIVQAVQAPAGSPAPADDDDDWFGVPDVAPVRTRQTVKDFFAVLGRARADVRKNPERVRVSAADIRAAADVTAGFGVFGTETRQPKPIAPPPQSESEMQDDVRRFRSWLDGLSES